MACGCWILCSLKQDLSKSDALCLSACKMAQEAIS